jgi:hypothetical protein
VLISATDSADQAIFEFWRLDESGLFYERELTSTVNTPPATNSAPRILWQFAGAIYCLNCLNRRLLSDPDLVTLSVTIRRIWGRTLEWQETASMTELSGQQTGNRGASHTFLDGMAAGLADHVIERSREVFRLFPVRESR